MRLATEACLKGILSDLSLAPMRLTKDEISHGSLFEGNSWRSLATLVKLVGMGGFLLDESASNWLLMLIPGLFSCLKKNKVILS